MMVHVTQVKYIKNYTLWLSFDDGSNGNIDLSADLKGPMFSPLKDINLFQQVYVDPELETIAWPNGADLAPEFLKGKLQNPPIHP